jgi:ubiquinone/menaquinone biosynthesis C-methylase UbiE
MSASLEGARFWDRTARDYAAARIKDMAGYERTIERIRALLDPAATVLEIGCGTGTTALRLAPFVGRIVATDVSAGMIGIARGKAAAVPDARVAFSVAPAEAAPSEEGGYDAILALNLLHLVADRAALLGRLRGQLKPGGLLISKTPCLAEMNSLLRLVVPVARLLGKAPPVAFFSAKALAAEIGAAGFTVIEQARHGSGRRDPRIFLVARVA